MFKPLIVSLGLLLSGCSQQFQDLNATFSEAIFGDADVSITAEYIQDLPYASIYAEINDQGKIFMVLAFVGQNPVTGAEQLKWMSSDKAMIVTENGRVVQTLLLPYENLSGLAVKPTKALVPSFDLSATPKAQEWQATYDWQPDYRFGYSANIVRTYLNEETVQTPIANFEARKFVEQISYPALGQYIENQYWVNKKGQVVKTVQYLGPEMTRLELTLLKPYQANQPK
ncbi:YjbF family lipoprotein [Vibrio coralliirubri]|uniref:YjbF family lipoprotein n=1 Tax=Vibrio coralliirubri TaxID=1516159 RepID=UPI0006341FD8|nr:YjbF family lipoprotein [Vibrio coralliirubri]CDU11040.1 Putative outer membrane lipoprotein [Vibrio coralliirubri]